MPLCTADDAEYAEEFNLKPLRPRFLCGGPSSLHCHSEERRDEESAPQLVTRAVARALSTFHFLLAPTCHFVLGTGYLVLTPGVHCLSMQAVVVSERGGPEKLQLGRVPDPEPKVISSGPEGEVVVDVAAVGVNF